MKRLICSLLFVGSFLQIVVAQSEGPKPKIVKEYLASSSENAVFAEPVYDPYEDYGVHMACDMSGRLYLLDYDKQIIHIVNATDFSIQKSFTVKPFPYDVLFMGDSDGIYYVSMSGFFQYIQQDGTVKFWGDLRKVMSFTADMDIKSYFYHANILFFMDNNNQIHSIINPGMDTAQNKKNYRNPEQTKKLFQKDSGVDLQGLTINKEGQYLINGVFVGPYFAPVIGNWKYMVNNLGSDITSIIIGNLEKRLVKIPIGIAPEHETAEGFAVHPSGLYPPLRQNKKGTYPLPY